MSTDVLFSMAEGTGGSYYHVNQADGLYKIFDTIAEKSDYYKDTDQDGLNDYYEKEMAAKRLVLGNGVPLVSIDYLNADSDGDGIKDGDEVKVIKQDDKINVYMYSNPTKKDTDEDGMEDNEDELPLVPNNISELLIHQTEMEEGLKKQTGSEKNIVADDLTFNDSSYTQIVKEIGLFGGVSKITPEFIIWGEFVELFMLGCVTSNIDMSVTLMRMLNEMKNGNSSNIGKTVALNDIYISDRYNRFSDRTLTKRALKYDAFDNYLKDIKNIVVDEISNNKGNLMKLEYTGSNKDVIKSKKINRYISYPIFSLKKDVSLVLAIHNFQGHNITIKNFKCDKKTFSGTIEFHFYDHFGLDRDDNQWAPGFCDWFTLQHYDRFKGKYCPYITVLDTKIDFSGEIKK